MKKEGKVVKIPFLTSDFAKAYLLECERIPFSVQKDTF
jgi:hypothetical protein